MTFYEWFTKRVNLEVGADLTESLLETLMREVWNAAYEEGWDNAKELYKNRFE